MRIALLSGAYGNAGDSLIEARSRALLENTFPGGAEVKVYSRKRLAEDFEEINACDLVVFSGGPIYQRDASPLLPNTASAPGRNDDPIEGAAAVREKETPLRAGADMTHTD